MSPNLNVGAKTIQFLEKNGGENLCDFGQENSSQDTKITQSIEELINWISLKL